MAAIFLFSIPAFPAYMVIIEAWYLIQMGICTWPRTQKERDHYDLYSLIYEHFSICPNPDFLIHTYNEPLLLDLCYIDT